MVGGTNRYSQSSGAVLLSLAVVPRLGAGVVVSWLSVADARLLPAVATGVLHATAGLRLSGERWRRRWRVGRLLVGGACPATSAARRRARKERGRARAQTTGRWQRERLKGPQRRQYGQLRRVRFRGWKMGGHLHLQGRRGGRRAGGRGGHGVAASVVRVRVLVLLVVLHRR